MSRKSYFSLNIYSILLVYIISFIHISFAFRQLSSTNINPISLGNFQANVSLALNQTATFSINLNFSVTNTTKLVAEWITSPIQPLKAVKNGIPDAILWSNQNGSIPIRISGQGHHIDADLSKQKCSKYYPCLDKQDNQQSSFSIDLNSFWKSYNRSYITIPIEQQQNNNSIWNISIQNYDRGRTWPSNVKLPQLKPILNGFLYLRFVTNDSLSCPGFIPDKSNENVTTLCGNHGTCQKGNCMCTFPYAGLDCMQFIEPISLNDNMKQLQQNENVQITSLTLQPFDQKIFQIKPFDRQQRVKLELKIQNGTFCEIGLPEKKPTGANKTRLQYYIHNDTIEDKNDMPLSFSDSGPPHNQTANNMNSTGCSSAPSREYPINGDTTLFIYANATGSRTDKPSPFQIVISAQLCVANANDICPTGGTRVTLQLIIVFVCLVTVAVTAIFMFAMFWLDRMHGFTRNIDKLTQGEVDRMYPAKSYPAQIADPDNTQRQTGNNRDVENAATSPLQEVECSICLCEFEDTDMVRKLACNHIFHSCCLDPWLVENRASCPTCRADVRLQHLSDKRRMRRIVTSCLYPIVSMRHRIAERRSRNLDVEEDRNEGTSDPDVETNIDGQRPAQPNSFRSLFSASGTRSTRGDTSSVEGTVGRLSLPGPGDFLLPSENPSSTLSFSTAAG